MISWVLHFIIFIVYRALMETIGYEHTQVYRMLLGLLKHPG